MIEGSAVNVMVMLISLFFRNTTNSAPGANIPLIGGITGGIGKLFG